jgi:hypothetical protein
MDEKDISLAARKMVEHYGSDAEIVAAGRAKALASRDEIEESIAWGRIAEAIYELRQKKAS